MAEIARQVLIAAKPKSGSGSSAQLVQALADELLRRGYSPQVIRSLEQLQQLTQKLWSEGTLRAVVSAGGDGTVGALANLLPNEVPILIFPMGTENLLAKHLGLGTEIGSACDALERQETTLLDVGSANGKLFLVMLSCGFDAEVVRRMHTLRTGHISRWSYTRPIFSAIRRYRFPQLRFECERSNDQANTTGSAAWLFIFNVPQYAANLQFCSQADPTDGKLDVCTFQRSGLLQGVGYLARLWFNAHQQLKDFNHQLTSEVFIPAPTTRSGQVLDVPFQIDGDPGGVLPLRVKTLKQRLRLIVPT